MVEIIKDPVYLESLRRGVVIVDRHPRIKVHEKDESGTESDTVGGIEFCDTYVEFKSEGDDPIQVLLVETKINPESTDNLVMIVGTQNTGPRLVLGTVTRRDQKLSGVVSIEESKYWTRINPQDNGIFIPAEEASSTQILDGEYLSPDSVTLILKDNGTITLTPSATPSD